jgi:hypothetical protein
MKVPRFPRDDFTVSGHTHLTRYLPRHAKKNAAEVSGRKSRIRGRDDSHSFCVELVWKSSTLLVAF